MLPIVVFTFILLIGESAYGYPSGAPEETCSSLSPEHGHGVPSQPVAQAPFYVVAHGKKFSPGDKIGVEIFQRDKVATFKGFLVQALDAVSHHPIGSFMSTTGMQPINSCSAITHTDPRPKKGVNLVWEATVPQSGEVIFRATIVQNKKLYYANILAYEAEQFYST
ncbi:ferric-chelate reductase 1 [Tetranychus urticae]|uniref:ferric-chelate reductase 1 n=1 Tax=Tetranychus urticae TaxID=32264 RepID=UPI00077BB8AC|nr:ferric-chelate reductase 1 [Tetranychus urticae]